MTGHLVLVGMMGSGKSTVGRLVAAQLDRPFLDSDEEVERSTGRTVAEIFAAEGEGAFRAEERRVLAEALASPDASVVAAAGGSVLDPANRSALAGAGAVVWLRADPATLARRVGDGAGRPLLGSDPAAALVRLAAERAQWYGEVADAVIDVDGLTPAEVATAVLQVGAPALRAAR